MKAVILDFDGVLVDSIEECFQVARTAFFGFAATPVDEKSIRKLFFKYRGVVRPPYEYLLLFQAIAAAGYRDVKDEILGYFVELQQSLSTQDRDIFEAVFFQVRAVKQKDIKAWVMLSPLTKYGKSLRGKELEDTVIVTTKDRYSVEQLLINNNIHVTRIYDRDDYKKFGNKGEIITNFLNDNSQYDSAIFVDDAVEHLDSVNDPRVKCYFADWGYGENSEYEIFQFTENLVEK